MPFQRSNDPKNKRTKKFELDDEAKRRIDEEFDDGELTGYTNYEPPPSDEDIQRKKLRKKRRRKFIFRLIVFCFIVIFINLAVWISTGQLWFNEPRKRDYPVRGPVITEEEGEINWEKFAAQNIQMAYIRATKSTAYVDKQFEYNKKKSAETQLPVGYYHVFDISMDGGEQAEHFIDTAGSPDGRVVPAVEVRRTGFYRLLPVDHEELAEKLADYADTIEEYYGVRPVIFCNENIYRNVVEANENLLGDCPIWIESLYSKPDEDISWDFWGYTDRIKFNYYESGGYLKMVLFGGSEEEFSKFILNGS